MAKFLNSWLFALGLVALICVGCKQSNSKEVGQMTIAGFFTLAPVTQDKNDDLIQSYKWITLTSYKDQHLAAIALNIIKQKGIIFSSEQIAEGKQRAEAFVKTNQFALPSTNQVNGL